MTDLALTQYRDILRHDLYAFIQRSFYELNPQTRFVSNWHIEIIAAKLEALRKGEIHRLIINVPPRSLKSHCASISFPAWLLGHDPAAQIIAVSYGQDLADKLARDCRTLMSSSFYRALFPTRLSPQKQATAEFETTKHGYRLSTSVGGVLMGRGGDYLIVDDPLKPDEAVSDIRRQAANDWYDSTLYSRLNNKATGRIVIIMQRLHMDDLIGHVLNQEPWEVVCLPAIAEQDEEFLIDTPYGRCFFNRTAGAVLHPEYESRETLERIRQTIGSYNFDGQYQQTPTPPGGGMIKAEWFKTYDSNQLPSTFDRIVQSWDTANKPTELSDYSVCTTWGVKEKQIYLLNVLRKRLNYPDLKRAVREQARAFNVTTILIEDNASGTQLIQELMVEGVRGVTKYVPKYDKVMRMHAQTATIENGFVHLPRAAHWLADYLQEMTTFPRGKHDDQVDSTAQALDWLTNLNMGSAYGWVEFYRRLAEGSQRVKIEKKVRLKGPPGKTPSHIYVYKGPILLVGNDGTVEVTEEQAVALLRNGWTKV